MVPLTMKAGDSPVSITVDPTGRFASVAHLASNNVWAHNIDASTGALTMAAPPTAVGTNPQSLVLSR